MHSKPEYHLLRLNFATPVRFGDGKGAAGLDNSSMTASSDTVFSAICIEWIRMYGESDLAELISSVESSVFNLTSLMPWYQKKEDISYYLPRPLLSGTSNSSEGTQIKKKLKKMNWIDASKMSDYLSFVKGEHSRLDDYDAGFGAEAVWDRVNTRSQDDPQPYIVSAFNFINKDEIQTGLYLIIKCNDNSLYKKVLSVITSVGLSGIGGKVSSGLGKYSVIEDDLAVSKSGCALAEMLECNKPEVNMQLSSVLPCEEEISELKNPESRYLLKSCQGFSGSERFVDSVTGNQLKRKSVNMIREGSCFQNALKGSLVDLSYGGLHPVYRMGKAFNLGLNL